MEFYGSDCQSLLSHMEEEEEKLKYKRRWLIGLFKLSKSETRQSKTSESIKNRSVPESLLREDDVFYETVKNFVEKGFGACNAEAGPYAVQDDKQQLDLCSIGRVIPNLLDDMTNSGLYHLAKILTGSSLKLDKTRRKMKRVIKEQLPKVLRDQNTNSNQIGVSKQLYQFLKDPHYFRENFPIPLTPTFQSHHPAVTKVLEGLESMSFQALKAMHRRLRGVPGMRQLKPHKSGWSRKGLIVQVRKTSLKMLSDLGEEDELQEPLAKAMAIGDLSLKLQFGSQNPPATRFLQMPLEIEKLQNDITRAIWLVENKIQLPVLKNLQLLLDPDAKVSNRSLRIAIKKLLIEYLFESSDMEIIPKSLLDAVAIINKSSQGTPHRLQSKEEEIESVLSLSAQMKQIMWDLLPDQEFDEAYTDAYIEDLEESDNNDDDGDNEQLGLPNTCRSYSNDAGSIAESMGQTEPVELKSPTSIMNENVFSWSCWESKFLNTPINQDGNQCYRSEVKSDPFVSVSFASTAKGHGTATYVEAQELKTDSAIPLDFSNEEAKELKTEEAQELKTDSAIPLNFSNEEAKVKHTVRSVTRNQYLAVQEVCDETSMVAYNLVGRILYEFARMDDLHSDSVDGLHLKGDNSIPEDSQDAKAFPSSAEDGLDRSAMVRVVEELIPSIPKSEMERMKKLLGL